MKYVLIVHYENGDKVFYGSILYKLSDYADELTNILGYEIYSIDEPIFRVTYPRDEAYYE